MAAKADDLNLAFDSFAVSTAIFALLRSRTTAGSIRAFLWIIHRPPSCLCWEQFVPRTSTYDAKIKRKDCSRRAPFFRAFCEGVRHSRNFAHPFLISGLVSRLGTTIESMPLASPEVRNLFEDALEHVQKEFKFVVVRYVVMPEHVHMLVKEPGQSTLDQAIKAVRLSVTFRDSMPLERLPLNQCLLQFWNTSP